MELLGCERDLALQFPSFTTRGHLQASEAQSTEGLMRSCKRTQELKCVDYVMSVTWMTHWIKVAESKIVVGFRHPERRQWKNTGRQKVHTH